MATPRKDILRVTREGSSSPYTPTQRPTLGDAATKTTYILQFRKILQFFGWNEFDFSPVSITLLVSAVIIGFVHCLGLGLCNGTCNWFVNLTRVIPVLLLIICVIRWTFTALRRAFMPFGTGEVNPSHVNGNAVSGGESWVDSVIYVPHVPGHMPFMPFCMDQYSNFVTGALLFALFTDVFISWQSVDILFQDISIAAELACHLSYTLAFSTGGPPAHLLRAIPVFIVAIALYILYHFVFIAPVLIKAHGIIDLPALIFILCDAAMVWRASARIGLVNNPFDRRGRQVWLAFAGSVLLVISLMIQWLISFERSGTNAWVYLCLWLRWLAHGLVAVSVRPARDVGIQ